MSRGFSVKAGYRGVKKDVKVEKTYEGSGAKPAIDRSVQQQAVVTAEVVKRMISQSGLILGRGSGGKGIKEYAIDAVDPVDSGEDFPRKKIYPGTTVRVSLVSSAAHPVGDSGGLGVWANYVLQYGQGKLPASLPWTKAVALRGGLITGGRK